MCLICLFANQRRDFVDAGRVGAGLDGRGVGAACRMSRSTLALRFKETVGVSPMEYLTGWRMLLARNRLANTSDSISAIAQPLATDPPAASAKPVGKSWAVRRGNTALARIRVPFAYGEGEATRTIRSNL